MRKAGGRTILALTAVTATGLGACTSSSGEGVADLPGVTSVTITENEGDDGLPFGAVPATAQVALGTEASAAQVMAVFEAFSDEVDSGAIQSVEVVLEGDKRATLATGEGIPATRLMVEELLDAHTDDQVVRYRREAFPTLPGVYLTVVPLGFDRLASIAEGYSDREEIEYVEVRSGDYLLGRDEVNEDLSFTDARIRFVQGVARRFRLTGAVVYGRGPLRVAVARAELSEARRFVDDSPQAADLGRIVVRSGPVSPAP